jgi:hypothetical protein
LGIDEQAAGAAADITGPKLGPGKAGGGGLGGKTQSGHEGDVALRLDEPVRRDLSGSFRQALQQVVVQGIQWGSVAAVGVVVGDAGLHRRNRRKQF